MTPSSPSMSPTQAKMFKQHHSQQHQSKTTVNSKKKCAEGAR